jgi:hypothetical protein
MSNELDVEQLVHKSGTLAVVDLEPSLEAEREA